MRADRSRAQGGPLLRARCHFANDSLTIGSSNNRVVICTGPELSRGQTDRPIRAPNAIEIDESDEGPSQPGKRDSIEGARAFSRILAPRVSARCQMLYKHHAREPQIVLLYCSAARIIFISESWWSRECVRGNWQ